jgi:small-conductance mechanosensitive channel
MSESAAPRPLPQGRMPVVSVSQLVAALHRRRERRRAVAQELRRALDGLSGAVDRHLERIAELSRAVEAQGGNLEPLRHYDNLMARLRAELRSAERSLAEAFRSAAGGDGAPA